MSAMHGLSRQFVSTGGIEGILKLAVKYISEIFDCKAVAMLPDGNGKLDVAAGDPSSVIHQDILKEQEVARSACETGRMTRLGTGEYT